jgi:hypothetical protein
MFAYRREKCIYIVAYMFLLPHTPSLSSVGYPEFLSVEFGRPRREADDSLPFIAEAKNA